MTDIIVFAGQSNMQGQTEKLLDSAAVPDAFEYKFATDSLVPLRDPFSEEPRTDTVRSSLRSAAFTRRRPDGTSSPSERQRAP